MITDHFGYFVVYIPFVKGGGRRLALSKAETLHGEPVDAKFLRQALIGASQRLVGITHADGSNAFLTIAESGENLSSIDRHTAKRVDAKIENGGGLLLRVLPGRGGQHLLVDAGAVIGPQDLINGTEKSDGRGKRYEFTDLNLVDRPEISGGGIPFTKRGSTESSKDEKMNTDISKAAVMPRAIRMAIPFGPGSSSVHKGTEVPPRLANQPQDGQPLTDSLGRLVGQREVLSERLKRVQAKYPLDGDVASAMEAASTGSQYLDDLVTQLDARGFVVGGAEASGIPALGQKVARTEFSKAIATSRANPMRLGLGRS